MDNYQNKVRLSNTLIIATILELAKRSTLTLPKSKLLDAVGVPVTGERAANQAFQSINKQIREVL